MDKDAEQGDKDAQEASTGSDKKKKPASSG
jgi:hypothetical protein